MTTKLLFVNMFYRDMCCYVCKYMNVRTDNKYASGKCVREKRWLTLSVVWIEVISWEVFQQDKENVGWDRRKKEFNTLVIANPTAKRKKLNAETEIFVGRINSDVFWIKSIAPRKKELFFLLHDVSISPYNSLPTPSLSSFSGRLFCLVIHAYNCNLPTP